MSDRIIPCRCCTCANSGRCVEINPEYVVEVEAELAAKAETERKFGTMMHEVMNERDALRAALAIKDSTAMALSASVSKLKAERDAALAREKVLEKRIRLAADDIAFFGFDSALVLNCGDTFAYACADAEEVPDDQIDLVRRMHDKFGYVGLTAWIAARRKCDPLPQLQTAGYREAREFLDRTAVPASGERSE